MKEIEISLDNLEEIKAQLPGYTEEEIISLITQQVGKKEEGDK